MRKIIVLKGISNTGKSTTIKELLKQIFEIEVFNLDGNDIVLTFKYKNKKIAIISYGDIFGLIKGYFNEIKDFDILIGACRSRGLTFGFYDKFNKIDGYDVEFIDKHEPTNKEQEETINKIITIISKEFNK